MSFEDIKGQDSALLLLKRSIESNKLSHAYIFLGPGGIGKKTVALNVAKGLNCGDAKDGSPCDRCACCKKIDALNHPDVFLLKPDKDGASIGIDKVRELIKNIGLKPYEARRKVYIIDDAGLMTHEAANAILKTLEEPPAGSVIILVAESLDEILPTIQSRSQIVKFFPLKPDAVKDILIKECGMDPTKAAVLSRISSGSIGAALKYEDAAIFKKRADIIERLISGSFFDPETDNISRNELRMHLDIMLTWYRDILVTKAGAAGSSAIVNADKADAIGKEAARLDFDYLEMMIKKIISTGAFLEQNINPKLAMGNLETYICTK